MDSGRYVHLQREHEGRNGDSSGTVLWWISCCSSSRGTGFGPPERVTELTPKGRSVVNGICNVLIYFS